MNQHCVHPVEAAAEALDTAETLEEVKVVVSGEVTETAMVKHGESGRYGRDEQWRWWRQQSWHRGRTSKIS